MSSGQHGSGWSIFGQRYDEHGEANGPEFQVNTQTISHQSHSSVAALDGGGFVVTWMSSGQHGSGYGIYGQRFDADGNAVGLEFQVNTYTASDQLYSSVAALDDGGFVVTWQSSGQDGSGWGIYGQRFDADGNASGDEFLVNETTMGSQEYPGVVGLPAAISPWSGPATAAATISASSCASSAQGVCRSALPATIR